MTAIAQHHLEQTSLNFYVYKSSKQEKSDFPMRYATDVSNLLERIDDFQDYQEKRNYGIERCLQEHKYLLSETAGRDIGIKLTIESFKTIFPGFDDGFLLAYLISEEKIPLIPDQRKSCSWFIREQGEELKTFFERLMIELMSEQGREITFREAEKETLDKYFEGFRAGFRCHFCRKKCKFPENCEIRELYK